jgi:hypothetical protein
MYLYNYFRPIRAGDFHQFNDFPTVPLRREKRQKRGENEGENLRRANTAKLEEK